MAKQWWNRLSGELVDTMDKRRYEREIEELLNRLDFDPEERNQRTRSGISRRLGAMARAFAGWSSAGWFSVGRLALVGIALIALGFFARFALGPISQLMIVIGALMLVGAYLLHFSRRRGPPRSQRRWRGRIIEFDRRPSGIERWLNGLFQRRRR